MAGFNIYQNRNRFKLGVGLMALVIGAVSLWYTDRLVRNLAERERRIIDLQARVTQLLAAPEDTPPEMLSFLINLQESNESVPMIQVDQDGKVINHRNLPIPPGSDSIKIVQAELARMKQEYEPIAVNLYGLNQLIYYRNSDLISQLRYYPWVQLSVISVFGLIAYLAFSTSRRAEQNRVWVGLAKETAHQLGTPISSLVAWVEVMKQDPRLQDEALVTELQKDIQRLEMITARFSNIGSVPTLSEENLMTVLENAISYLRKRVSTKVDFSLTYVGPPEQVPIARVNVPLFEWVIENLCKNAVDAMNGVGQLSLVVEALPEGRFAIDITDTGKGMTKAQRKRVFDPGFTTKKRGWGLGLTLAKRIIQDYHRGKIGVKASEPGKGTTFRITL